MASRRGAAPTRPKHCLRHFVGAAPRREGFLIQSFVGLKPENMALGFRFYGLIGGLLHGKQIGLQGRPIFMDH